MTVTLIKNDPDGQWFSANKDRQAHIRKPVPVLMTDKATHITRYMDECGLEFQSLGDHSKDRRRILLWKVPANNPFYNPQKPQILKIPFLAYSDETIEDTDEILLPIIHEIMTDAAN